jgi:GNAT superfamily N-acetyltransferase
VGRATRAGPGPPLGEPASALPETGIVSLDPDDGAQLEAFAALHEATLPDSVPVRFGRRFMTRFYFPKLVADGLAAGHLLRIEGRWAGFGFYTKVPHTMLREGIRRHFFFLCRLMPAVFLAHPRALLAIPRLLRNRGGFPERPNTGYLLTLGVHPDFQGQRVEGEPVSGLLMTRMLVYFREVGCDAVEATVERANERALAFYRRCGFSVEDRGFGGGSQLQIRYELSGRPSSAGPRPS